ncbi:MAG: hypothetical protein ABFC34_07760 [Methanobacterium sp.]
MGIKIKMSKRMKDFMEKALKCSEFELTGILDKFADNIYEHEDNKTESKDMKEPRYIVEKFVRFGGSYYGIVDTQSLDTIKDGVFVSFKDVFSPYPDLSFSAKKEAEKLCERLNIQERINSLKEIRDLGA